MAGKGLFAVMAPPPDDEDFSDDLLPPEDEAEEVDPLAGPFEAYAETVFSDADVATKSDALRQAILTILEERGGS